MGKASARKEARQSPEQRAAPKLRPVPTMRLTDRELLQAHETLLRRLVDFLRSANFPRQRPSDVLVVGLAVRVLQLAHALHLLVEGGHAGEGGPIARAILSGCASLVAICDTDRDGRAYAYTLSARLPKARVEAAAKELGMAPDDAARFAAAAVEANRGNAQAFRDAGVYQRKMGLRKDTWHGLTDRKLFSEMGMSLWYEIFYRTFSDESHVNARAIGPELDEVLAADIGLGSKFARSFEVLTASGRCAAEVVAQLNLTFEWNRRPEILKISESFESAVRAYRHEESSV